MAMMDIEHMSVPTAFKNIANIRADNIAMRHKDHGLWQEISWKEYYNNAASITHGLMSLGVELGDFIGIIGENCPEWLYMDMGIQMAGAKTVGIYTTNSSKQVHYILQHAQCKVLFAENEEQVDKWLEIKNDLPLLEYVIYWDNKGLEQLENEMLLDLSDLMKIGVQSLKSDPDLHLHRIAAVEPEDIAILVYTSGTTGNPKGAMLSSKNLLWVANNLAKNNSDFLGNNDQTMSFLPLCHIFERMFSVYLPLASDYVINFAESTDTIAQNIKEIRPTVGYAVPRVWEKFQSSIAIKMSDAPYLNRICYNKALRIGRLYSQKKLANEKISTGLKILRFIAYWSVLYPLKYMMGMNKMKVALSGAAPISPKVLEFYHALDILMLEGYGMTETAAMISISKPEEFKLGTVGKCIEGGEIRLSEEGEILVKHPGVIRGYYKQPEASEVAIIDGWLHTGDMGEFDKEGFLTIIDRKKDIIITAGGKNIAPQKIENKLKASIYINDAIVIGDKRKFISAIIVLDEENINKYARDQKIQYTSYSDLASHLVIHKLIDSEVDEVNKELARVESIRKFTILDKRLYVEDGEVTPTMKVKRKFINDEYSDLIEKMYF